MQILLIPLLIIFIPVVVLFFVLQFLGKTKKVSLLLKIALGLIFIVIGLVATCFAVVVSINGIADKGISCATGAVVFIPLGVLVNVTAIPLLLISFQKRFSGSLNSTGQQHQAIGMLKFRH